MRLHLALVALLTAGCAEAVSEGSDDDGRVLEDGALACFEPSGKYDAVYMKRDGDCADDAPNLVPNVFIDRPATLRAITQMFETYDVAMVSRVEGCNVIFEEDVVGLDGTLLLRIEAQARATREGTIVGTADVSQYDGAEEPSCTGRYDVELTPVAEDAGQQ